MIILKIELLDNSTDNLLEEFKTIGSNPKLKHKTHFLIHKPANYIRQGEENKKTPELFHASKQIKKIFLNKTSCLPKRRSQRMLQNMIQLHVPETENTSRRKDLVYKSALRKLKRFCKNIFKTQNLEVVRRRYINCRIGHLYNKMYQTLQTIISEEYLTNDLIYFTMGIAGIRKPSGLPCSNQLRQEILEIVSCASFFPEKVSKMSSLCKLPNIDPKYSRVSGRIMGKRTAYCNESLLNSISSLNWQHINQKCSDASLAEFILFDHKNVPNFS
ncbi:unnamed protein product [Moneuplotes crassus]|uniref:Uncharacterized protein n=1 Tax=Euplotes crassus TaxID=5936 RepID=A0AAD2DAY4_EUPCR|nr:unnamed protein product [Moneuplotes crassus]